MSSAASLRRLVDAAEGDAAPGFRPLYRQVRDLLVRRLAGGVWTPGAPLPSETELAAELRVSQGTVRKALDEMAAERLVVRRQGRGTFVAEHDEQRILFQFFKLRPDSGVEAFPESRIIDVRQGKPTQEERARLALRGAGEVTRIRRVRVIAGMPAICETIAAPTKLFPGLARMDVPNNLYGLYSRRFGVTVAVGSERLKAVALPAEEAAYLRARQGAPALLIDRIALTLEGAHAEWRVSYCLTDSLHYLSELR